MNTRSPGLTVLLVFSCVGGLRAQDLPRTFEVTARSGLNVRDAADGEKYEGGALRWGTWVEGLERHGEWVRIGEERFVHGGYLRPAGHSLAGVQRFDAEDSNRGAYQVTLEIQAVEDDVRVLRTARYGDVQEVQRGVGRAVDGWLTAELDSEQGAVGVLEGRRGGTAVTVRLRRTPDGAVELEETSARGEGTARRAPPAGPATDARIETPEGPHLLSVGLRKVEEKLFERAGKELLDGVGLDEEVGLTRFLHVGVGGEVRAIPDSRLTPVQAEQRSAHPRHVWVQSRVHGGVRVPLSTTVPLGDLALRVGFETGARVDYTVQDLYEVPRGVRDSRVLVEQLRSMGARTFSLPLSAGDARALTPGAKRGMEGRAHVAVSGELSFGLAGGTDTVAQAAKLRVGGFYRISGRARIQVERLRDAVVRVRVSRARTHERGVTADLVLQASLQDAFLREELSPAIDYVDQALIDTGKLTAAQRAALVAAGEDALVDGANSIVRKVLRFRVRARASTANERSFDLAYRFDLDRPRAREAYERAVRGDFTVAAASVAEQGSGVTRDHRVLGFERRRHRSANLELSVFLNARVSQTITTGSLVVDDRDGRTHFDYWRYDREVHVEVFDRQRGRSINAEIVRRRRGEETQRSLRMRVQIIRRVTWAQDAHGLQGQFAGWGLDASSDFPRRRDRGLTSAYRNSTTVVELQIGNRGLQRLLSKRHADYFNAYLREVEAYWGEPRLWGTVAGQARMRNNDNGYQRERRELEAALQFGRHMTALAGEPSTRRRERALRWIASSAKQNLYAVGALIRLVQPAERTLEASIVGRGIRVVDRQQGDRAIDIFQVR